MPNLPPDDELEAAFMNRDQSFDGLFFAAVTTTGIFCRPSCPARRPKPGNVKYYATAAVRAVARANGMNRVAILVPCHRVIGSDGGLGGYGGGIWRKERLLEIEGDLKSHGKGGTGKEHG